MTLSLLKLEMGWWEEGQKGTGGGGGGFSHGSCMCVHLHQISIVFI